MRNARSETAGSNEWSNVNAFLTEDRKRKRAVSPRRSQGRKAGDCAPLSRAEAMRNARADGRATGEPQQIAPGFHSRCATRTDDDGGLPRDRPNRWDETFRGRRESIQEKLSTIYSRRRPSVKTTASAFSLRHVPTKRRAVTLCAWRFARFPDDRLVERVVTRVY